MSVELLTYTKVDVGWAVPNLELVPHDAEVERFLLDVLAGLAAGAPPGDHAPTFVDVAARSRFRSVRDGTPAEFLQGALDLARNLVDEMDGRTRVGLFVCVRARVDGRPVAAALKLQVATEHAARLEQVADGSLKLSAVTDVVDPPGNLEKGAMLDGIGPTERLVLGDKLREKSLYFPRALGVVSGERPTRTAHRVVAEIQRVAGAPVAVAAAAALPAVPAGTVAQVLDALEVRNVRLTPTQKATVVDILGRSTRPVNQVSTAGPVSTVYDLDGITVTVRQGQEHRLRIEKTDAGYDVVATTPTAPEPRFS